MYPKEKLSLEVFGVIIDDQSGGFTALILKSKEAWIKELYDDQHVSKGKVRKGAPTIEEFTEEVDDDEYQNGYQAGTLTIELEKNDDGKWELADEISFHGGQ